MTLNEALQGLSLGSLRSIFLFLFGCCLLMPGTAHAQAQAAIFDMVRAANAAIDAGQLKKDDAQPLLQAVEKFDEIFAVLKDDDAPKMKSILDWAEAEGRAVHHGDTLRLQQFPDEILVRLSRS